MEKKSLKRVSKGGLSKRANKETRAEENIVRSESQYKTSKRRKTVEATNVLAFIISNNRERRGSRLQLRVYKCVFQKVAGKVVRKVMSGILARHVFRPEKGLPYEMV